MLSWFTLAGIMDHGPGTVGNQTTRDCWFAEKSRRVKAKGRYDLDAGISN